MSYTVLMYHEIRKKHERVGDNPISVLNKYQDILPTPLYCDYDDFEEQMAYLIHEQYHFLRMEDIIQYHLGNKSLPPKSVLITFDDAYQSVLKYAYPILKKHNISGSLFLVTGWLQENTSDYNDKESRTLTYKEVTSMKDIFELVNHTHVLHERNDNMRSNLMSASLDTIQKDLYTCNKYVDIKNVFAYPFGFYDEKTADKIQQCGMDCAFTSKPGINTTDTHPLYLHRYPVYYGCTLDDFTKMLVK